MKTILIVDDNKLNLATARSVLNHEYKVIPVMKGQQALTYLENGECDIVLLDIKMPEMDGFEVLEKMREMERCRNLPVIFLTADNDAETETRCFKAGAVDFIAKPFVPEVMLSRVSRALEIEELRRSLADRLEQKTKEVSDIKSKYQQDALTGLWDRSYTEETVNGMLERGTPGALMMMDLDNFKSVNDNYGHITGDKVLKMIADTLRECSSEGDVLCRIGGDEFMVFVKDVTLKTEVGDLAEDIISGFRNKLEVCGYETDTSVSIGIAWAPDNGTEFSKLYNSADKALYYVKRNGKNSYHFFGDRLLNERSRSKELIDLKYLHDLVSRADNVEGAYLLDFESFHHVYNCIHRSVDYNNRDVSMVLFTISDDENEKAMDLLEKAVYTLQPRSNIITRYSSKQLILIRTDANNENSNIVAERILENFNKLYTDRIVQIDYSTAHIKDLS